MPTSALCTCISFSLVLYFFKALNSNFVFECPTNAILQRVSKTVAQARGTPHIKGVGMLVRPFQILLGNFLATFRILSNFFVREQLLATFRKTSTFLVTFGLF